MSIIRTQLDGQNITLALTAPDTFVDVLAVNIVTGGVTSAWLPAGNIAYAEQAIALANSVVPPLDRTSLNYLARLVNVLPMDDSIFAGSSVLTAPDIYTLRITAVAGVDPAVLLVNLPQSVTGAFAVADGAQGIAPPALLAGDAIGPSNANQLVAFGPGPVTRGAADKVAVVTTDAKGRVFTLTETPIAFPAPGTFQAVYGAFSDNADQPLAAGVPATVRFNTVEGANGVSVQNNGLGVPTRLTVAAAGIYEFSLSPQLLHTGGGGTTITFWAATNTGTVPRSASSLEMGNNNNRTLPFIALILPMGAGDWLEWVFVSTGANTSLEHFAAAAPIPEIPSVIASVKLIGS